MEAVREQLARVLPARIEGTISRTTGTTAAVANFPVPVGAQVEIARQTGPPLRAEVIGFQDDLTLLFPLGAVDGVCRGNRVRLRRTAPQLPVGKALLGRVINAQGRAIDGRPQPPLIDRVPRHRPAPPAVQRPTIDTPFSTGIRAIDGLLPCGKGQRMGIFSAAGVGKSVLLGMMTRHTCADVNVIALIGERGREVNEFTQRELGPEGLARSVVVVATSDEPAPVRLQAALSAVAVAEYFRDRGGDVLLLMDSVTRLAMAGRELGLAAGEPPAARGYPPSVYALLPKIIERAGLTTAGSITAFFSVLVEGDDPQEPISDLLRGLLDGHIWLSRQLAAAGQYPAIDILDSVSRLATDVTTVDQQQAAQRIRRLLAVYREHADLISIGAYRRGSNPLVDEALALREPIHRYLCQLRDETVTMEAARRGLIELAAMSPVPAER